MGKRIRLPILCFLFLCSAVTYAMVSPSNPSNPGVGAVIRFDFRAFIGGTSNQSYTNAQVLDTVAEGVIDGSLTVVDTSTGTVAAVDGKLELVGDGSLYIATGAVVTGATTRALGKALFVSSGADGALNSKFGFDTNPALATVPDDAHLQRAAANAFDFRLGSGTIIRTFDINNTQTYQMLLLLGNADINGVPFKVGDTATNFLYGSRVYGKGGSFSDWTLLWLSSSGNTATLYVQFETLTVVRKATYNNILIPEKPLSPPKMFQPRFLATFQGTNGDSIRDVYEPDVVNSVSNPGVTALESGGDTWDIQSNSARNTPGLDADIAPDNTCTTDVARTEVNDTSSWTNVSWNTFESVTETSEPNGSFSLHLVSTAAGNHGYTTASTVVGLPYRASVIYKKNIATDNSRLRIGTAILDGSNGESSLVSGSFTTITLPFIALSTTTYFTVFENGGNDNAEIWIDTLIVEPITLNELFASDDMGIDEGIFDISGTIPNTNDGQVGMGLFLDSYTNPQNGILPYYNRLVGKAQLFKLVGGVGTSLINVTATYAADAQLRVIAYRDGSDLLVRLYYAGAFIGTEQTISNAGIVDNTRHGQTSVDTDIRISILSVMPRNDPAWDIEISRGTGGVY